MTREGLIGLAIVSLGAGVAWALAAGRPVPADPRSVPATPVVRVAAVVPGTHRVLVRTHGTVEPRTNTDLVAEVSGRVTRVSSALVAGGFFEAGEMLLEIERADYENAVRQSRAALTRAESELELQAAELERTLALTKRNVASASALDQRRHARRSAHAALEEARAALARAQRDLARTRLLAPFAGRVRSEDVDVGRFVSRGTPLARLYAVDFAEVRLPVHDGDLAFLDLPLGYRGEQESPRLPAVSLRGRFAGGLHTWRGRIVRSEGEIDPRSRMLHLVARVEDPYARRDARPPLAVGMFVEAEIEGRVLEDVLELPRTAVRDDARILVVDAEDRIRLRAVTPLRRDGERVIVRAELAPDERVCLSQLDTAVDGLHVRPFAEEERTKLAERRP